MLLLVMVAAVTCLTGVAPTESSPRREPTATPPNFLVILVDDLGVEHLDFYSVSEQPAPTPQLSALAANGLIFTEAWASPLCSPSRAMLQTGRHAFRTGIGTNTFRNPVSRLSLDELILPELLRSYAPTAYASGLFGKWHLGSDEEAGGELAPNLAGYDHFAGTLGSDNPGDAYFDFPRTVNGATSRVTNVYRTTDTVNSAIDWINTTAGPWLAVVAPLAVHQPFHWPPKKLHTQDQSKPGTLPMFRAMVEAFDHEIGRLLESIDTTNTLIVFAADNGSAREVAIPPVPPGRAKGSLYQGGVRVPLVIVGEGVGVGQVDALVSLTDLFATLAEVSGAEPPPEVDLDSVSLTPYFAQPDLPSIRSFTFTEMFRPNGYPPYTLSVQAARNYRYKYGENDGTLEAMVDLWVDPWESTDLLRGELSPEEEDARAELSLLIEDLVGSCRLGEKGDTCGKPSECCSGVCSRRWFWNPKTCK